MATKPCNQQELAGIFCKSKATISEILSLTRLPHAIRDECRMDPTVPKRVLIDIARPEDEGQMQAAFEKYKAKVNPVKPSETVRPTPAQRIITAVEVSSRRVGSFRSKLAGLTLEKLENFVSGLECHRDTVDEVLMEAREQLENARTQAEDAAAGADESGTIPPKKKRIA